MSGFILEDGIDNVATNSSTSTEDSSIAQLFAKFLAHLSAFARFALDRLISNLHRGDCAIVWVTWTRWRGTLRLLRSIASSVWGIGLLATVVAGLWGIFNI